MITPRVCFAASSVIRDAQTNAISAFNILESITAVGIPFFIQAAAFFVLWERAANDPAHADGTFTLSINGEQLVTAQVAADFGDQLKNRTVVNLNGLVVPAPGVLHFRVVLNVGDPHPQAEYFVTVSAPQPAVH